MGNFLVGVFAGISVAAAFLAIQAALVLVAWNWVVPPVLHGPHLAYWSAFALSLLAFLLLGGVQRIKIGVERD